MKKNIITLLDTKTNTVFVFSSIRSLVRHNSKFDHLRRLKLPVMPIVIDEFIINKTAIEK